MNAIGRAIHFSIVRRFMTLILLLLLLVGSTGVSVIAAAQTTLYGPYGGCYYVWDGAIYSDAMCPRSDGSVDFYVRSATRWQFVVKVTSYDNGAAIYNFADGSRIELSYDGSFVAYLTNGEYYRFASDGSLLSGGYVDSQGINFQTIGPSPGTLYPRVLPVAGMPIGTNVFGLLTKAQDLGAYDACLTHGDSNTDYDGDYRTGFNELAEHCGS